MSHLRVAYLFIGVASGYSYEVIMKLLEMYKPKYGTWLYMDHPSKKDKELNYWSDWGYAVTTLSVHTKNSYKHCTSTRIRKENQ